ncbi:hypothetical protein Droror1_Dr00025591 [Drosera rotundifolia]
MCIVAAILEFASLVSWLTQGVKAVRSGVVVRFKIGCGLSCVHSGQVVVPYKDYYWFWDSIEVEVEWGLIRPVLEERGLFDASEGGAAWIRNWEFLSALLLKYCGCDFGVRLSLVSWLTQGVKAVRSGVVVRFKIGCGLSCVHSGSSCCAIQGLLLVLGLNRGRGRMGANPPCTGRASATKEKRSRNTSPFPAHPWAATQSSGASASSQSFPCRAVVTRRVSQPDPCAVVALALPPGESPAAPSFSAGLPHSCAVVSGCFWT